jgi:hypothetical protein
VEIKPNETPTAILFELRHSPIARRTSVTVAATGFTFLILWMITSGSFKPCPVTVQTISLPSGIF